MHRQRFYYLTTFSQRRITCLHMCKLSLRFTFTIHVHAQHARLSQSCGQNDFLLSAKKKNFICARISSSPTFPCLSCRPRVSNLIARTYTISKENLHIHEFLYRSPHKLCNLYNTRLITWLNQIPLVVTYIVVQS